MKTLAAIVLFNPEIERLNQNIEAIFNQVDDVVLIDNGSSNLNEVKKNVTHQVHYVVNEKNVGIAKALNEGFEYAIENGFDWVLTLDQDSVSDKNLIEV
jgi:rhamnosyltransferase